MDEIIPPEIGIPLDFLAANIRAEFIRLFKKCLTSRSYGMEHRMDHNRDLMVLRIFMRGKELQLPRVNDEDETFDFDRVCSWLDYTPDDARRRIARVQTWDIIHDYLESNGSPVRMPGMETHVDALFALDRERRGPAWAQFYQASIAGHIPITESNIRAWVENYKALPVDAEITFVVEPDKPQDPEVSQDSVPQGTKPAVAVEVTPGIPLTQAPGQGALFKHPERVTKAIDKIALACGGDNVARREEWRAILGDPVKVDFQDLLEWADQDMETIRRIASLATGNLHSGLRSAMRIVKGVIDARTTLNFLLNRCRADGGRLEHAYGPYKIIITYQKDQDYNET